MIAPPLAGNVLGSAGHSFAVAEWRDAGGESASPRHIAPWHVHHKDDEAWYVLEGALSVRAGDEVIELPAGSAYLVPRGTPHTYWNPGPAPVRYLLFMTPTILRLIQSIHAATDRSPAAMAALFAQHDSALVDPPPGL
ncbi:cupin domain-containing protein [Occallatibacter riparius]|uniref:Cupin domain-containing protein n=1 Tax=Occallatibacter riparius TaxID=1002689 RepID=A0A9J7BN72_9BACT|nr:cupin domain-containing protein [Occallatibacter riparius]UWZ84176.1 cupin domain-containing protein [Occallatibacter riparius]